MQWIQLATTAIGLVQSITASILAESELNSVAVDLPLNVPGQVHIGTYKQVGDGMFIRELPRVNVYFSLQLEPTESVVDPLRKWQFHGYECSPDTVGENRDCSEFIVATLESDRDEEQLGRSQTPHIIDRQSPVTNEERRLQFDDLGTVAPPAFPTRTAYYNCGYTGGNSNWCCAQSSQGSGGPYCWSTSKCSEEWSGWNQQNIICCTASAGDCVVT
eukprot:jgi/Phyca11/116697/e_gw1.31.448.1